MIPPGSTYRLQIRGDMTLGRAAALAGYFKALGVTHLYLSPIFAATPGSTHGYDVVDFNQIDPAVGGEDGFAYLCAAARSNGLGLILDFVPNHMGATVHNPWWRDVLQWGQASDHHEHFDIDWTAPKLIVPTLGETYGDALERGLFGLELDPEAGEILFAYYDQRLPLTPPSYARILARIEHEPFPELARRFAVARPETVAASRDELVAQAGDPPARAEIDAVLQAISADTAAIHDVHEAQNWRLSHWRAAREGLTYRRFFEIADLVGVRIERPRVFEDAHRLIRSLVEDGRVEGIRLDHIDGLADPKAYLQQLQDALGGSAYLLVEKILGPGETVRTEWPIAGTTGYEFAKNLGELFVDPAGCEALTEAYGFFTGGAAPYDELVLATKRRILTRNLAGELEYLRDIAKTIAARDPATRDYGPDSLRRAVLEMASALPLYRTYVNIEGPNDSDRAVIAAAADFVRATREVEDEGAIGFVAKMLTLDFPDPEAQAAALVFTARFQQTTGPVMAKALEDTVFYRYNRLIALNEVGGEPDRFGAPLPAFHAAMEARLAEQPAGLSTTATHDTKRGEDARARLYAVSEQPQRWAADVARWSAALAHLRRDGADGPAPEPATEWLFYQALAGSWPPALTPDDGAGLAEMRERFGAYMLKAIREAKDRTSWAAPSPDYEDAISAFVDGAFADRAFLDDFAAATGWLRLAGAATSLSQLAIKLSAPGIPDIYQGSEYWDLSLVDPDNRRPFDYSSRESAVATLADEPLDALLADWPSARVKLRLMQSGLRLRAAEPALFASGAYLPLELRGPAAAQAIAFARLHEGRAAVTIAAVRASRLLADAETPLVPPASWGDTAVILPAALAGLSFRDIVSGRDHPAAATLPLAEALHDLPCAILMA